MREEGKEKGREGLSLPLQMSVDDRVKLTCSPTLYLYMGRRVVPANGGASDHSINQYSEMVRPLYPTQSVTPSSSEHVDTHAQRV